MSPTDLISLVTNIGFPVTLCFILIRYVLQTIGERLDHLDQSLAQLVKAIQNLPDNTKSSKKGNDS